MPKLRFHPPLRCDGTRRVRAVGGRVAQKDEAARRHYTAHPLHHPSRLRLGRQTLVGGCGRAAPGGPLASLRLVPSRRPCLVWVVPLAALLLLLPCCAAVLRAFAARCPRARCSCVLRLAAALVLFFLRSAFPIAGSKTNPKKGFHFSALLCFPLSVFSMQLVAGSPLLPTGFTRVGALFFVFISSL